MKTDPQLQNDVLDELAWDPALQAGSITVQARQGVVTLSGELSSYAEKWSAERAAKRVAGVRLVSVLLTVRAPAAGPRSDADIAHAARNVLAWLVLPPPHAVQVAVRDGWLTLSGQVPLLAQKPAMLATLGLLPGVRGVTDTVQVQVDPPAAQAGLPDRGRIEAAIRRRFSTGAQRVSVVVQGGRVTLSGQIHSPVERELAQHAAWGTPGVYQVHDRLRLVG